MGKFQDLTGKRFGRLVAIEYLGNSRWKCKCDCGKYHEVLAYSLKNGITRSCGCFNIERAIETNTTHGQANTKLYGVWCAIKRRCYKAYDKRYKNYGNRGIVMCEEWKNNFQSFYRWSMANGYKEHLTIDRIDNNGNYEPSNCRWATNKEQSRNKTNNHIIEYNGEKMTAVEFAEKYNINYSTLLTRLWRKQDIFNLIKEK